MCNAAIADSPHHLERLITFWSSVMLATGVYKGSSMATHLRHRYHRSRHVQSLADLWDEVTGDLLDAGPAQVLQAMARTIAESLKLALYFGLNRQRWEYEAPVALQIAAGFDETTSPQGLRNDRSTRVGVVGPVARARGRVALVFNDPGRAIEFEVAVDNPADRAARHPSRRDPGLDADAGRFHREPPPATW